MEWRAFCQEQAEILALPGLEAETTPLLPYLRSMNEMGFYTCSSQPNKNGMRAHQRAYVSGYMQLDMWNYLYAKLPRDIVIWECQSKSALPVAFDSATTPPHYSWSGRMNEFERTSPFRGHVVSFHAVDMDWDRYEYYLFEKIVAALKEYNV